MVSTSQAQQAELVQVDAEPATTLVPPATIPAPDMEPIVSLPRLQLRPYQPSDAASIAAAADSPLIAQYMRDQFPSPYTLADAEAWIAIASARGPPLRNFAILAVDEGGTGTYAGGIGLRPMADIERRTMEIGYWLGEQHWGRGLATAALRAFSRWAFENIPDLVRLEAGVFAPNVASARVLTKAGYTFEGTRRQAIVKHGAVLDQKIFSLLRDECLVSQHN